MIGIPGADFPLRAGAIVGFDPGRRKTGIAVGHTRTGVAKPVATWRCDSQQWGESLFQDKISGLIAEWKPVVFVVGLSRTADQAESAQERRSRAFAEMLQPFSLPICLVDERLSSHMAAERLRELPKKSQSLGLDAMAAALIIETYLTEYPVSSSD